MPGMSELHPLALRFASAMQALPPAATVRVGLSGGMDSVSLLALLSDYQRAHNPPWQLAAIHVNHGLQSEAHEWQAFCEQLCRKLDIPLNVRKVTVSSTGSLEAAAREARYGAFSQVLTAQDVLVLAQHLDDQLETLLLRLMRGSGPTGLSGMPRSRPLGQATLFRPLLDCKRDELLAYAQANALEWKEDPSNSNIEFDRNYCRQRVLPQLAERWPGYRDSWLKSQSLLAESNVLLTELAAADLQSIREDEGGSLNLSKLQNLSQPRQRNLLRHWLGGLGVQEPGWNVLQQLSKEVIPAGNDSKAFVEFDEISLRVAGGRLQALRLPALPGEQGQHWNAVENGQLHLPDNGALLAALVMGQGLGRIHADALEIRYRRGGESIRLPGRPTKSLKKLLQEEGYAPWLRERLPLLYEGERLVCIPGFGPLTECAAKPDEPGIVIDWQAPQFAVRPQSDL